MRRFDRIREMIGHSGPSRPDNYDELVQLWRAITWNIGIGCLAIAVVVALAALGGR